MSVRISISFSDGLYTMHAQPPRKLMGGTTTISNVEWAAYQAHCRDCQRWHERMRDLCNTIAEREDADAVMTALRNRVLR